VGLLWGSLGLISACCGFVVVLLYIGLLWICCSFVVSLL